MNGEMFSPKRIWISVLNAIDGLQIMLREEVNFQIHLLAIVVVVAMGFLYDISGMDWILITMTIGLVLSLEIINSAIENLADFVSPVKHPMIKRVKDLAAAAVLVGAGVAVITASLIFLPKMI